MIVPITGGDCEGAIEGTGFHRFTGEPDRPATRLADCVSDRACKRVEVPERPGQS